MSSDWACTICSHARRTEIEAAIVSGRTVRSISEEFEIGKSIVHRHKAEGHILRTLKKATLSPCCPVDKRDEILALWQSDKLVEWLQNLLGKSVKILDQAEASGDLKTALSGIHEARQNVEAIAKITGTIQQGTLNQQINIGPSQEEMNKTISRVIQALEAYPEARQSVLAALDEGVKVIDVVANE